MPDETCPICRRPFGDEVRHHHGVFTMATPPGPPPPPGSFPRASWDDPKWRLATHNSWGNASGYPGPYHCVDCGVWWAGFEHRCHAPVLKYDTDISTVRCTCPPDRGDNFLGTCPIHDVQSTNTLAHQLTSIGVEPER
jgi:hypothetical protein